MKHKVFLGSIIAAVAAFVLYAANIKRVENAQLKVVGPKTSKIEQKNKKKTKLRRHRQRN